MSETVPVTPDYLRVFSIEGSKGINTQLGVDHFRSVVAEINDAQGKIHTFDRDKEEFPHFSDRYLVKGDARYAIQFADPKNPKMEKFTATSFISGPSVSVDGEVPVAARLWVTNNDVSEKPVATCYKLLDLGNGKMQWIRQVSNKVRTEDDVNHWTLQDEKELVTDEEMQLLTHQIMEASGVNANVSQN